MYMIEITEDKFENIIEHLGKGLKYMSKAMECLDDIKDRSKTKTMNYDIEDDYDDYDSDDSRYGNRNRQERTRNHRGRYDRY